MSDYDDHVAGSLGKAVDPADKQAILPLLRSILDLDPVNRETVRRVVRAMFSARPRGRG